MTQQVGAEEALLPPVAEGNLPFSPPSLLLLEEIEPDRQ